MPRGSRTFRTVIDLNGQLVAIPTRCSADSNCASNQACFSQPLIGGAFCLPKLPNGAPGCTSDGQCQSGNCVTGGTGGGYCGQ